MGSMRMLVVNQTIVMETIDNVGASSNSKGLKTVAFGRYQAHPKGST
jgi:hypothetical protein